MAYKIMSCTHALKVEILKKLIRLKITQRSTLLSGDKSTGSLTQSSLIPAFFLIWPEVQWELHNNVEFQILIKGVRGI